MNRIYFMATNKKIKTKETWYQKKKFTYEAFIKKFRIKFRIKLCSKENRNINYGKHFTAAVVLFHLSPITIEHSNV